MLGKLSIRDFTPQTAKKGKQVTKRKKDLRDEFIRQNKDLKVIKENCKGKELSLKVTFYLNNNTPDKSSYKKDLDNLLKILLDVFPEFMDDGRKEPGLGIIEENKDELISEIKCYKDFVKSKSDEGIDVKFLEWKSTMELSNQYDIPCTDIPRGIELALKNSDRLRDDAEILGRKEERYNSAIPLITLAVEELGKAILLSEYFEKNTSIPHKEGQDIFRNHNLRIDTVFDYVKDIVKQRPISTRIKKDSTAASFHIPEELDDQDFKERMWYVDYQKIENPETPWKKQSPWKNPMYIEELDFGEGNYPASSTLEYKYYDMWRCAFHGIRKFRNTPLYDKILNEIPHEEFSLEQMGSYLKKHFFLEEGPHEVGYGESSIEIHISPTHTWITPILAEKIREHIQKKYHFKEVDIILEKSFW